MLLPSWLLARRCDGTAVIGEMLSRAARGQGFRSIAAVSEVPEDTVRDRLRRFRRQRPGSGSSSPGWPGSWRWIRFLDPGDLPAVPGEDLEFTESRPYGGAYVLDAL